MDEVQRVCVDHQAAGLKRDGSEAGKSLPGTDTSETVTSGCQHLVGATSVSY